MSAHIHTNTYIHTHIQNIHMNARKHAWNDGVAANVRGAVADAGTFCTSLSFDAIKAHFALPMQGLHCTHFLKHQYPSTPYPLFPTYPRTVRGPRASAVLLFYTEKMNRVHSSEEAPRSFTIAPCVVVERLEGKQRCSRAAVGEHEGIQAREWSRWLFTKKRQVIEKRPNPATAHYTITITTVRSPDNIQSSALVQGRSTQFIANPCRWPQRRSPETRLHFRHFGGLFFSPFRHCDLHREQNGTVEIAFLWTPFMWQHANSSQSSLTSGSKLCINLLLVSSTCRLISGDEITWHSVRACEHHGAKRRFQKALDLEVDKASASGNYACVYMSDKNAFICH